MLSSHEDLRLNLMLLGWRSVFSSIVSKKLLFPMGEMDELFLGIMYLFLSGRKAGRPDNGRASVLCVVWVWQGIPIDSFCTHLFVTECTHEARRLWNSAQNGAATRNWVFQNWLAEDLGYSFTFVSPHTPIYLCKMNAFGILVRLNESVWNDLL